MKTRQTTAILVFLSIPTFAQTPKQEFGNSNFLDKKKIEYKYSGKYSISALELLNKRTDSAHMETLIKPTNTTRLNNGIISTMPVLSPDSTIDKEILVMKPNQNIHYYMRYIGPEIANKVEEEKESN